nr:LG24G003870-2 protein [Siniperca chuatsi]
MGFREAVLLGLVFLLSGANLCAATQNWFNFSTNESLNQIPQQVTTSLQLPRLPQTADHQSNRTEHSDPVHSPVSFQLRSFQLRSPAVNKQKPLRPLVVQMQTSQNRQRLEARKLTSAQLEPRESVQAQEMLKLPVRGPDLNPPVKQESKVQVFEQRVPVPASSVAVRCGEGEVTVAVNQNFLGNGQSIRPSDLTLGGCAALGTTDHILQFQTELQGCGSTVMMTEEALIYSFSLMYSPTPIGNTFILKTNPAEVVIKCHYRRGLAVTEAF